MMEYYSEYYKAHKNDMKVSMVSTVMLIKMLFQGVLYCSCAGVENRFKSHYMKHKQAILKPRALYSGKLKNEAIAASRALNAKNANSAVSHAQKHYYAKLRAQYCAGMRQRYDLAGLKLFIQHHYITEVCRNVLGS